MGLPGPEKNVKYWPRKAKHLYRESKRLLLYVHVNKITNTIPKFICGTWYSSYLRNMGPECWEGLRPLQLPSQVDVDQGPAVREEQLSRKTKRMGKAFQVQVIEVLRGPMYT